MALIWTDITRNQYNIPPTKQVRFSEFAKLYMEKYSRLNKRSWRRDEVSLSSLLPYFGEKTMDKILPLAIEGYKAKRLNTGRKPATINRELALLKHMMSMAVNWNMAWSNPMKGKGVKLFREDNIQTRFLTREEQGLLLQACPDTLRPIVQMALLTGMRLGELLALKWAQVDLSKSPGVITVVRSKSGKSRQIPVCPSLEAILLTLKRKATLEHVFVSGRTGRPYTSIRTAWEAALKRSGLAPCTFHSLRHTYGTYLADQGVPLPALQKLMGHSTILVTSRYAHGTPRAEREAAVHLENMLPDEKYGKNMESQGEEAKKITAVSL
jgi:integrase